MDIAARLASSAPATSANASDRRGELRAGVDDHRSQARYTPLEQAVRSSASAARLPTRSTGRSPVAQRGQRRSVAVSSATPAGGQASRPAFQPRQDIAVGVRPE